MSLLISLLAAPAVASDIPIAEYHDCIVSAAARLADARVTAETVADRAVAFCATQRRAVVNAEMRFLRSQPAYRGRSDLDAAAETALGRFEGKFKKDAEMTALVSPGP